MAQSPACRPMKCSSALWQSAAENNSHSRSREERRLRVSQKLSITNIGFPESPGMDRYPFALSIKFRLKDKGSAGGKSKPVGEWIVQTKTVCFRRDFTLIS